MAKGITSSPLLPVKQLSEKIKLREISPVDLVEICLDRIKKFNPSLDAFITVYAKNVRCTAGSKILSDYIPDFDATVVKKMKQAEAILIGTNNLNEFASGITGINPYYGNSKNPLRRIRIMPIIAYAPVF